MICIYVGAHVSSIPVILLYMGGCIYIYMSDNIALSTYMYLLHMQSVNGEQLIHMHFTWEIRFKNGMPYMYFGCKLFVYQKQ